ncbi:MAG TPA: glycosyltransferase family 2 protein, partial [Candidatus Obscuribacterales bacterium]
ACGEYLFLLNSDTLITANPLPTLIQKLQQDPTLGIVGPRLINPDGSFQLSTAYAIGLWGEFRTLQRVKKYRQPTQRSALAQRYQGDLRVDIVVGAAMLMPRSLFQHIGGFDENFFMYFEESDLCQRVRDLGYQILYTADVSLIHIGGYSVAKAAGKMAVEYRRSQRYYYQKHRPFWEQWLLHQYLAYKQWRQRAAG